MIPDVLHGTSKFGGLVPALPLIVRRVLGLRNLRRRLHVPLLRVHLLHLLDVGRLPLAIECLASAGQLNASVLVLALGGVHTLSTRRIRLSALAELVVAETFSYVL